MTEGPVGEATGGRRPRSLRFNAEHAVSVVATMDTTHARVAITDLSGRIPDHVDVEVSVDQEFSADAVNARLAR